MSSRVGLARGRCFPTGATDAAGGTGSSDATGGTGATGGAGGSDGAGGTASEDGAYATAGRDAPEESDVSDVVPFPPNRLTARTTIPTDHTIHAPMRDRRPGGTDSV